MAANNKIETASVLTGDVCLIYATFPTEAMAETVGRWLVMQRLAACVNILPKMTSIYEWQAQLCSEAEVVMLIKTTALRSGSVISSIREKHPYDNPAIIVLPITDGSADFMRWIGAQTT